MKKKAKEETYSLTLKGLLVGEVGLVAADTIMDAIELYGFRHDKNAVLIRAGGEFVYVEEEK